MLSALLSGCNLKTVPFRGNTLIVFISYASLAKVNKMNKSFLFPPAQNTPIFSSTALSYEMNGSCVI